MTIAATNSEDDETAFLYEMAQDTGKGLEDVRPADLGLPWFKLLQRLSSELDRGDAAYIPGSRDGLWLDSVGHGLYQSLLVVPVKFVTNYLEWTSRSEGAKFVRNYGSDPSAFDEARMGHTGCKGVTSEGNEIAPAGTWFCLVLTGRREGVEEDIALHKRGVFSFRGSAQKISRQWLGQASTLMAVDPDGRTFQPPLFAMSWRLGAAATKNAKGNWALPTVMRERWVSELPQGRAIYESAREYAAFATEYCALDRPRVDRKLVA